jgi:DNA-binding IclR family transcriptional regulator
VTVTRARRKGMTADALATILELPLGTMVALLEDCERHGTVERLGGNYWALTRKADERFGRALRGLEEAA